MSTTDDNESLVRRLIEIVNAGDLSGLEEVATGPIAEEARRWVGPFRTSFPDFGMDLVDVIAEAEKVAGYFQCSGTHEGEWRGIPATGRRFELVDEIYIFRVEDGKLAEALAMVEDNLTRMRQVGVHAQREVSGPRITLQVYRPLFAGDGDVPALVSALQVATTSLPSKVLLRLRRERRPPKPNRRPRPEARRW